MYLIAPLNRLNFLEFKALHSPGVC